MAYVPTVFYVGAPTTGTGTLYTGPGSGAVLIVKEIILTNNSALTRTVNIWFVPSGGSPDNTNAVVAAVAVQPGYPVVLALSSVLNASDTIQGNVSSNTSVSVRISGIVGP